jgi:hypothetical protein
LNGRSQSYRDDERTRPTGQMALVANLSMGDEGATSHIEMRRALIDHYSHRQVP